MSCNNCKCNPTPNDHGFANAELGLGAAPPPDDFVRCQEDEVIHSTLPVAPPYPDELARLERNIRVQEMNRLLDAAQAYFPASVERATVEPPNLDTLWGKGVELEPSGRAEVRVVDEKTGGEKGSKLARFDLIPVLPLTELAEHFGRGARKYADRNWERGYAWSLSYAALCRHLTAWWGGEDCDPETGSNHMVAVAWHAMALREFQARQLGTDNRPVKP